MHCDLAYGLGTLQKRRRTGRLRVDGSGRKLGARFGRRPVKERMRQVADADLDLERDGRFDANLGLDHEVGGGMLGGGRKGIQHAGRRPKGRSQRR